MAKVDWKVMVTQITTVYNGGEQKSISEYTAYWSMRLIDYNRQGAHWFPVLAIKNRNLRLVRIGLIKINNWNV